MPAVLAAAALITPSAFGAQLIDRNASGVKIAVNAKGEALLTYTAAGKLKHVLAWGAEDARVPTPGGQQVKFKLDYAGGWGKYHTLYWKRFGGNCGYYDGPPIPNMVTACRAADGSYWAAQSWQQPLPDLGFTPWTSALSAYWLELSHWSGDLPKLEVQTGWVYDGRFQNVFGRSMPASSLRWLGATTRTQDSGETGAETRLPLVAVGSPPYPPRFPEISFGGLDNCSTARVTSS